MFFFSRGATWMRRGNPGHVAAPRGPTRRLRGALYTYIYIVYRTYIVMSAFRISEGYSTYICAGYYKPGAFLQLIPWGTNPHVLLTMLVTWTRTERRIDGARRYHASIGWTADHQIKIKARALNGEL